MPWFYRNTVDDQEHIVGPFDTDDACRQQRDAHAAAKPEDDCGEPEEHPKAYMHDFYTAKWSTLD